jgi:hypothetical protein
MHIKFFFEQQLAVIADHIRASFGILASLDAILAPAAEMRKNTKKSIRDMDDAVQSIIDKHARIAQAEREIADAKNSIADIKVHDLGKLQALRDERAAICNEIAGIDNRVSSVISSSMRLLRRFGHESSDKRIAETIHSMETNPSDAFYSDPEFIRTVISNASASAKSEPVLPNHSSSLSRK